MSTRSNDCAPKIGARTMAVALALALSGVLSACDGLAANEPRVALHIGSQPGEVLGFDPPTISAPPATRVAVTFTNMSTVEHNVVFLEPLDSRTREIVLPGEVEYLEFTTPVSGNYEFVCTIHIGMTGTLRVT